MVQFESLFLFIGVLGPLTCTDKTEGYVWCQSCFTILCHAFYLYFLKIYLLFIYFMYFWLHWVLVAAPRIFVEAYGIFRCSVRASL